MKFGKGFENPAEEKSSIESEEKQQNQESEDQPNVPYVLKCVEEGYAATGVKLGESAFEEKKEELENVKSSLDKMKADFESKKQLIENLPVYGIKDELLTFESVIGEAELLIREIEENKNALKFYKLEEKMRYLEPTIKHILKIAEERDEMVRKFEK